ncbi:unnamed protein product, partial [Effrenium voratum]
STMLCPCFAQGEAAKESLDGSQLDVLSPLATTLPGPDQPENVELFMGLGMLKSSFFTASLALPRLPRERSLGLGLGSADDQQLMVLSVGGAAAQHNQRGANQRPSRCMTELPR